MILHSKNDSGAERKGYAQHAAFSLTSEIKSPLKVGLQKSTIVLFFLFLENTLMAAVFRIQVISLQRAFGASDHMMLSAMITCSTVK